MSMRHWLGGSAIILAVVGLGGLLLAKNSRGVSAQDSDFVTAVAAHRDIASSIIADGTVGYRTQVAISAEVIARVDRIHVKPGDHVALGQPLITLDDRQLQAQIAQRKHSYLAQQSVSDHARAEAALQSTRLRRFQRLWSDRFVSRNQLDEQMAQVDIANAAYAESRQNMLLAQALLLETEEQQRKTVIRSPMDGTVLSIDVAVGETAVPSTQSFAGTALVRIADTSSLMVKALISEADVARLNPGAAAMVIVPAIGQQRFAATVATIALAPPLHAGMAAGEGKRGAVSYEADFQLLPGKLEQIRSGMSCRVEVRRAQSGSASVAVPVEAVRAAADSGIGDADEFIVWQLKPDGSPVAIPVGVGVADDRFQEVTGLAEGQRVIVGPATRLAQLGAGGSSASPEAARD